MNEERSSHDPDDKSWIEKIAHMFSAEPKCRKDLLDVLLVAQQNEIIDHDVMTIIEGAMQVADMQVREIMVPRTQMVVIKAEEPLCKSLPCIIQSAHSRYPVIGENTDEVIGILLAKDLLPQVLENNTDNFDIKPLLRTATVIPESKRLNVLLREFREKRNHMAIVIDEYGGVAGLITIEDVLEQIVGEIEDEHDVEQDHFIKKLADNDYIVKALTTIDEFNDQFNAELEDEEVDTIGGLVLQRFGHLPRRNEVTVIDGYQFKVINGDSRQIHLLRMSKLPSDS